MSNFGSVFASEMESVLDQLVRVIESVPAAALNEPLGVPETNTMFVIGWHTLGAVEHWVCGWAGGEPVQRDRDAEFRATGSITDLRARRDALVPRLHAVLGALPDARLPEISHHPSGEITVGGALLRALDHAAQHLGHAEVTRQLVLARGA